MRWSQMTRKSPDQEFAGFPNSRQCSLEGLIGWTVDDRKASRYNIHQIALQYSQNISRFD